MSNMKYVTFLEAMKAYIEDDYDVIFHGDGYEDILFDAKRSKMYLTEMFALDGYTFYDLTNGKWSVVK